MKITVEGNVFEGTPEEIKEMMTLMGAEFPEVKPEEHAEEAPTFREGDRVKALADGEFYDVKAGEVGEITDTDVGGYGGDHYSIRVSTYYDYDYFRPQDLELVTEEEVKFAKLGRKPGEFKKGDIVRVTDSPAALPVGTIFEVERVDKYDGSVYDSSPRQYVYMLPEEQLELITPVESRVDIVD